MRPHQICLKKGCARWYKTETSHVAIPKARLVAPVGTRVSRRVRRHSPLIDLEQELQAKLNEPRVCARCRCGYNAEVYVVCVATDGVRRRKLRAIKDIEELRTKLQSEALSEPCPLEHRKIKVVDPLRPQPRIHSRFVTKCEIGWRFKTRRIEPFQYLAIVRITQS